MGILTQHMYKAPVPIRPGAGARRAAGTRGGGAQALSKKPEQRYQTMEELRRTWKNCGAGWFPMRCPR